MVSWPRLPPETANPFASARCLLKYWPTTTKLGPAMQPNPTPTAREVKGNLLRLLFYTIATVFQLYHGSDMMHEMRRRNPEPILLPT